MCLLSHNLCLALCALLVWGTILSGVEDARQLEQLRVYMSGKPVSIVWSFHIVGVSDVMTLNAVLLCRGGLVRSGTTLPSQHWRRLKSHGHTAGVGKWSLTSLALSLWWVCVYMCMCVHACVLLHASQDSIFLLGLWRIVPCARKHTGCCHQADVCCCHGHNWKKGPVCVEVKSGWWVGHQSGGV